MNITRRTLVALLSLAAPDARRCRLWPRKRRSRVEVKTNLTYYSGEGADKYRHRLDMYVPKGQRDVPVMMFVHGGGFTVGIKDQYGFVGEVLASRGIATAVISYRLSPKASLSGPRAGRRARVRMGARARGRVRRQGRQDLHLRPFRRRDARGHARRRSGVSEGSRRIARSRRRRDSDQRQLHAVVPVGHVPGRRAGRSRSRCATRRRSITWPARTRRS